MKSRWLGIFILLGSVVVSQAQNVTPPPLPAGPLLKRAPDYSTWTVKIQGQLLMGRMKQDTGKDGDGDHSQTVVAESKVTKTGPIILEQDMDATGEERDIWHIKDIRVTKMPGAVAPFICSEFNAGDIYSVDFSRTDFAGLDWISSNTYTGVAKFQGRNCIVFKSELTLMPATSYSKEWTVPVMAYVDLESRLPLAAQIGSERRSYQYGSVPKEVMTLPSSISGQLKEYLEDIKRRSAPAARGY